MTAPSSLAWLGPRLRQYREAQGKRLLNVSQATGLSLSHISDMERGRSLPSLDALARLCDCYGISMGELFLEAETLAWAQRIRLRLLDGMAAEIAQQRAWLVGVGEGTPETAGEAGG